MVHYLFKQQGEDIDCPFWSDRRRFSLKSPLISDKHVSYYLYVSIHIINTSCIYSSSRIRDMGQGMAVSAAKVNDLFSSITFDHPQAYLHPNQIKPVFVLLSRYSQYRIGWIIVGLIGLLMSWYTTLWFFI